MLPLDYLTNGNITAVICPSKSLTKANHERTSEKHKMREILQKSLPVLFKSVKVIQNKERWRNYQTLDKLRNDDYRKVKFPGLDPRTLHDICE